MPPPKGRAFAHRDIGRGGARRSTKKRGGKKKKENAMLGWVLFSREVEDPTPGAKSFNLRKKKGECEWGLLRKRDAGFGEEGKSSVPPSGGRKGEETKGNGR